jgi:hypothetical protein
MHLLQRGSKPYLPSRNSTTRCRAMNGHNHQIIYQIPVIRHCRIGTALFGTSGAAQVHHLGFTLTIKISSSTRTNAQVALSYWEVMFLMTSERSMKPDRCYSGVCVRGCAVSRGVEGALRRGICASGSIGYRLVTGWEGRGTVVTCVGVGGLV